jgi:hypothetical protein
MPELLLFAYDHASAMPTPSVHQIAALPKPYDVITWQRDGWPWGDRELAHPWFRIVVWPDAAAADLDTLLSPLLPSGGVSGTPQHLGQYRGFHLTLPPALADWWGDHSRAAPKMAMPAMSSVARLRTARAPIANPAFIGLTPSVIS